MKNKIINLTDNNFSLDSIPELSNFSSLLPFDTRVCEYLNVLSKNLLKNKIARQYPDVITFGFYCRKANINSLKRKYSSEALRIGRGIAFHIAPSNVPVNFAYSLISGLLSGNTNIVKLPSKNFDQVNIICDEVNKTLNLSGFEKLKQRINLIKYDKSSDITNIISNYADIRIIWGGDETVNHVKSIKSSPRCVDISFPDRYSLCVINSKEYLKSTSKEKVALDFYNDTYLFDQNACTAPHSVFWIGNSNDNQEAKILFWKMLNVVIDKNQYQVQMKASVDKLCAYQSQIAEGKSVNKEINKNLWIISNTEIVQHPDNYKCSSGYFNEFKINNVQEVFKIIKRNYQTLSYYGFDKNNLHKYLNDFRPLGIDRIVPIGRTMDFSLSWDGYNLINIMTREVSII